MTLKRALIVVTAAAMTAGAVSIFVMGIGRDAFVGDISVAFGPTTYALSVGAVAIAVIVLVALLAVTITRRSAK